MDTQEQLSLIARPLPGAHGRHIPAPPENPTVDVPADDPLLEPRADEPGIGADGNCNPIENPG
jgi:hypothetical protein